MSEREREKRGRDKSKEIWMKKGEMDGKDRDELRMIKRKEKEKIAVRKFSRALR